MCNFFIASSLNIHFFADSFLFSVFIAWFLIELITNNNEVLMGIFFFDGEILCGIYFCNFGPYLLFRVTIFLI